MFRTIGITISAILAVASGRTANADAAPGESALVSGVPGAQLSSEATRIQGHDPELPHWLLRELSLPANVGDNIDAFSTAGAVWVTAPTDSSLLQGATEDDAIVFYHGDHLGSSNVMTDRMGNLVQETAHYPFGTARHSHTSASPFRAPYGFTQKEQDRESDLHYFEARYLAAGNSRFLSPDPKFANPAMLSKAELAAYQAQPQKINVYTYVLNNPMIYHDPNGLDNKSTPNATEKNQTVQDLDSISQYSGYGDNAFSTLDQLLGASNVKAATAASPYLKGGSAITSGVSVISSGMSFAADPSAESGNNFVKTAAIAGVQVCLPGVGLGLAVGDLTLGHVYKNTPIIHDAANKKGAQIEAVTGSRVLGGMAAADQAVGNTIFKVGAMIAIGAGGGGAMGAQVVEEKIDRAIAWASGIR